LNFERNRPLMISCELVFRPNKLVFLKYNQWSQSSSSLLILSTSRGILTSREAFSHRLGGIVLCKIT
jgi:ribosomal protein S8